jgi:ABC-type multidrug transport system fused ATPase/permease subunit
VDLNAISAGRWQAVCSVLFQRFIRFHLTVRQNIGFGDITHLEDLDRIRAAAEVSGVMNYVNGLPSTWDTHLGRMFEQGCELSEGQWQRLAIARAAMRSQAQVYVLDEPGAWLDAKEESEVLRRFNAISRDGIGLLISHRLSAVASADLILVLESGRLVASGTHSQLMSGCNLYRELYQRQASGYLRSPTSDLETSMNGNWLPPTVER